MNQPPYTLAEVLQRIDQLRQIIHSLRQGLSGFEGDAPSNSPTAFVGGSVLRT